MDDLVIGIDLGTTNSCVSLFINGNTKILENSYGGRITPSFIFFTSLQETIVGEHAKRIAGSKPDHGIYEVKRLVGKKFKDSHIQKNMQYLSFKIQSDAEGNPLVIIKQRNTTLRKTPEELCTIILKKLKSDVEAKLGQKIEKVVITVPAYFNVTQREVTLKAAQEAGFTVLKLLNEPTAAALSYYFENDSNGTDYSLVYDLGGGTFDIAVLKRSANNIQILGVDGDTQLGGHDFDNLIVNYVCEQLKKNYNYDPSTNKENLRRLHNKCEDAKRALSAVQKTVINLIGFVQDHPLVQIWITREHFEDIANELFQTTIKMLDSCLKSCGVSKNSIKEVILSGGSTRIPKIQKMVSDYFNGKTLNKFVNPDECVAEGAALQAALLSKDAKQRIKKIILADVVPLSLGIFTLCDKMNFVIRRNSQIPTQSSFSFVTVYDSQTSVLFQIYEGERLNVKRNRLIGDFTLSNLTPAPPGQCTVTFSMSLDENGVLTVKAQETYKNNVKKLSINYTRGSQSEEEIKNTLLDFEQNREEDERFENFVTLKRYLLQYCIAVRYNMDNKKITDKHRGVYELCQETESSSLHMDVEDKDRVKELIEEIKTQCEPFVKFYNFALMPVFQE